MDKSIAWEMAYKNHSLSSRLSYEVFREVFWDWNIFPVIYRDRVVASILTRKSEAHMVCDASYKGKWFSRKVFNSTVGKQLKLYGYATTSCFKNSEYIPLILKLGYEKQRIKNDKIYFKMTRNKYENKVFT